MAPRFDVAGDHYTRTTDILDFNSPYTLMADVYISVDLAANSSFYMIDDGANSNVDIARLTSTRALQARCAVAGTPTNSAAGTVLAV